MWQLPQRPSVNLPLKRHTKQDLFVCLGIWLALELVCFVWLPLFGLIDRAPEPWLSSSVVLGLVGSVLFAVSSQMFLTLGDRQKRYLRNGQWAFALLFAWLGLVGVAYPFLIICIQVSNKVFEVLLS